MNVPARPESSARTISRRVVARLGVEPEWTVTEGDSCGFVAHEVGVWLSPGVPTGDETNVRVEVRIARDVSDTLMTRRFLKCPPTSSAP
jgi:hypothetical protein